MLTERSQLLWWSCYILKTFSESFISLCNNNLYHNRIYRTFIASYTARQHLSINLFCVGSAALNKRPCGICIQAWEQNTPGFKSWHCPLLSLWICTNCSTLIKLHFFTYMQWAQRQLLDLYTYLPQNWT